MSNTEYPSQVLNLLHGQHEPSSGEKYLNKINPHNGKTITVFARSNSEDVDRAVKFALQEQNAWAEVPPVRRGQILFDIASMMKERRKDIADLVAIETGKSPKDALAETDGAILLALFMAGEGQRLYGRTTTTSVEHKTAMTIREPVGVAGLIVSANTPIANISWKVFPALICGNSVVLKSSENAPLTAWIFGEIALKAGLPPGVLNIIHGLGNESGKSLVEHPGIQLISFTGSTAVGKDIEQRVAGRLMKVSLELGGKNPLIVCDDADMHRAVRWTVLSAFSNAGQRCASASRVIVMKSIYDQYRDAFLETVSSLKVGNTDQDDFGPVINENSLMKIMKIVEGSERDGSKILAGGKRMMDAYHRDGYYMEPTVIENVDLNQEISLTEIFGPVVCLYCADNYQEALEMANHSPYGLTACIHTRNVNRAGEFIKKIKSGVAVVNGGTYGSEPHMPFGGVKSSSNGSREPGTEALEFYSNIKDIYQFTDPSQCDIRNSGETHL